VEWVTDGRRGTITIDVGIAAVSGISMSTPIEGEAERHDVAVDGAALPVISGRYQLLERLGEGGMGVVWRCFDLDLEEPVAVKFLREDLAKDDLLRAYFRREVKLARRVTHPNVARVFEFGRDGALHYLTMEFIAGESLQTLIERDGRVEGEAMPRLATSLLRGLAAAHAVGIVHGDIKPANILLDPVRGAVLADFGIARALTELPTADEGTAGTLIYMAPEQLNGGAATLQSDVYAAGVVLFQALIGALPWPSLESAELLEIKREGWQPDLKTLVPDLAPIWAELLNDCLRVDPALRPAGAGALRSRLAELRSTDPWIHQPRIGALGQIAEVTQQPSRTAIASLLAVGQGAEVTQQPSRTAIASLLAVGQGPKWIEVLPFSAEAQPGGAAWVSGALTDALTQVRGIRAVVASEGPQPVSLPPLAQVRGELRETADEVVVTMHLVDHDAAAEVREFEVHQPRTALHNLGAALALEIASVVEQRADVGALRCYADMEPDAAEQAVQARAAFTALRPDVALRLYEMALLRAPDHPLLRVGHTLARLQAAVMFRDPAPEEMAALRRRAEAAVVEHPKIGDAHVVMSGVLNTMNDPVPAARAAATALRYSPNLVPAMGIVGDMLTEIGRFPDSERRLEIALALDPKSLLIWLYRARLLAYQGRWEEFYALIRGPLTEMRFRSAHTLRMTLWHPDEPTLVMVEAALAVNADSLPPPLLLDARAVVAFALGRGDRRQILAEMLAAHPIDRRSRHARVAAMIMCEMACCLGEIDQARELLAVVDEQALIDWHWIEACPTIAALRGEPLFAEVRARVRIRADAVAAAIWG
jgi:eukaryotic-like serine/threonine-protein kinase